MTKSNLGKESFIRLMVPYHSPLSKKSGQPLTGQERGGRNGSRDHGEAGREAEIMQSSAFYFLMACSVQWLYHPQCLDCTHINHYSRNSFLKLRSLSHRYLRRARRAVVRLVKGPLLFARLYFHIYSGIPLYAIFFKEMCM